MPLLPYRWSAFFFSHRQTLILQPLQGLLVFLGWGQGPSCPSVGYAQAGHLLFSLMPIALGTRSCCGPAWFLLCPESLSISAADRVVTPCVGGKMGDMGSPRCFVSPHVTFLLGMCGRWDQVGGGSSWLPSHMWALLGRASGVLRFWGSNLHVSSGSLSRCQHPAAQGFELPETN